MYKGKKKTVPPYSSLPYICLLSCNREYISNVFPRQPRPLYELPCWKATELLLDLLYICPIAYKQFLKSARYNHIMLLHVTIKILVNRNMCKAYATYAESLLKLYVSSGAQLYGAKYVTFNVCTKQVG